MTDFGMKTEVEDEIEKFHNNVGKISCIRI